MGDYIPRRNGNVGGNGPMPESWNEVFKLVMLTLSDEEAWRRTRPRVVQWLARHGARIKDDAEAGRVADVFHRAPHLMPLPAPRGADDGPGGAPRR